MTDFLDRLRGLSSIGPELALELIATVIDGLGTGTEWSGEQLDRLGELTQTLADKIRGIQETKG
jgi:predicted metal-dependent hydrolase